MNSVIRTFLLWLLVLALPVQGFAAAVNESHGTAHSHDLRILALDHAHSHDATVMQHGHAFHVTNDDDAKNGSSHQSGKQLSASTCSVCASCCAGAFILPSVLEWHPVHASTNAAPAAQSPPYSGHYPERLKRPPRVFLV